MSPIQLTKKRGSILVSVIIAIALFGIGIVVLLNLSLNVKKLQLKNKDLSAAVWYAVEAQEVIRNIRDQNYSLLTNGTHGLDLNGAVWRLYGIEDTRDYFTRNVFIDDARTNASGVLDTSGTNIDTDTKRIIVTVSWSQPFGSDQNHQIVSYVTNYR